MTDNRARAARTDAEDERRINAIVDRRLREWGKVGLPPGTYGSYQWDGYRIVGGGTGASRRFGAASQSVADSTTVEYDFAGGEFTILYDPPTDASWMDANSPPRIIVPFTGILQTTFDPYWVTDNTTGDRLLEVWQERDSISAGYLWNSNKWAWPSLKTNQFLSTYPALVWQWDVVAGDAFRVFNEHNAGISRNIILESIFLQIG